MRKGKRMKLPDFLDEVEVCHQCGIICAPQNSKIDKYWVCPVCKNENFKYNS